MAAGKFGATSVVKASFFPVASDSTAVKTVWTTSLSE